MRYLIKWTKEGTMKYISHLDMMRLFQRTLKRGGIKLEYSQGFSPHPKMSIAQPLTLGHTSQGEYIEIETVEDWTQEQLKERLSGAMPSGIHVVSCSRLEDTKKAIGALVMYAAYIITVEAKTLVEKEDIKKAVYSFLQAEHIYIQKIQKKSGKTVQINIKEFIKTFGNMESDENQIRISTVIKTGSQAHLNPDLLVNSFRSFLPLSGEEMAISVTRVEMYAESERGELIPLYQLK